MNNHLKLQDALLNAASYDKPGHMDGLVLPQPVNAVLCLLLHCWIPPEYKYSVLTTHSCVQK